MDKRAGLPFEPVPNDVTIARSSNTRNRIDKPSTGQQISSRTSFDDCNTGGFIWMIIGNDKINEIHLPTRQSCRLKYMISSTESKVYIAVEMSPGRVGAESSLSGVRQLQ